MRVDSLLPLAGACFLVVGCAGAESGARPEPLNVSSYSSSGASGGSGSASFGALAASSSPAEAGAGILAPPDMLEVPFAIAVEAEGAAAIAALEPEAKGVAKRLEQATGRAVVTRMRTIRFENVAYGKMESPRKQTIAEGCVDVDLGKDSDFWSRARVLAAVAGATPAAHVVKREGHRMTFGAPIPRVRDAESRRPELVSRWMSRSRAFIAGAGADADGESKLHLSDCAPPLEIRQAPVGTDEVLLSLPATCKLASDAPR